VSNNALNVSAGFFCCRPLEAKSSSSGKRGYAVSVAPRAVFIDCVRDYTFSAFMSLSICSHALMSLCVEWAHGRDASPGRARSREDFACFANAKERSGGEMNRRGLAAPINHTQNAWAEDMPGPANGRTEENYWA
jgi:hypothetical protein